jgi:hypothetical protein
MPEVPVEGRAVFLDLLDRRRAANDAAMWQAPVVLTAAQAFLLQVLANQEIGWLARSIVLAAGLGVTAATLYTLLRGRTREVQYTEGIDIYLQRFGYPSTTPSAMPSRRHERNKHLFRRLDQRMRAWARSERLPVPYQLWALGLFIFVAADIAVFVATI